MHFLFFLFLSFPAPIWTFSSFSSPFNGPIFRLFFSLSPSIQEHSGLFRFTVFYNTETRGRKFQRPSVSRSARGWCAKWCVGTLILYTTLLSVPCSSAGPRQTAAFCINTACWHQDSTYESLMIETDTVSETSDTISTLSRLVAREDFVVCCHLSSLISYKNVIPLSTNDFDINDSKYKLRYSLLKVTTHFLNARLLQRVRSSQALLPRNSHRESTKYVVSILPSL